MCDERLRTQFRAIANYVYWKIHTICSERQIHTHRHSHTRVAVTRFSHINGRMQEQTLMLSACWPRLTTIASIIVVVVASIVVEC